MWKRLSQSLPLIALCAVLLAPYYWWKIDLTLNPVNHETLKKSDITLYATSWCPYCYQTRRFLQHANIPFTEWDIEKSPRAYQQYQQISGHGVPVIQIGPNIIHGYDQSAIRNAIDNLIEARQ